MWGERVCPGPPGTGCFDLHLGRVGVSAVMVHQGHARSASHWQARSTDLKLSQTPPPEAAADVAGSAQLVRKVGWLLSPRGPQASILQLAGVQTRTTGRDRGLTAGRTRHTD